MASKYRSTLRCIEALAPQHWQILIVGAEHGSRAVGRSVTKLLDAVKPSVIFVELDRYHFSKLHPTTSDEAAEEWVAESVALAVPECASAVAWATLPEHPERAVDTHRCSVFPIDRDQRTTRRRLTHKLAQSPGQLLPARRYWGAALDSLDPASVLAWRRQLQLDCPALYDVVYDERDEFMTYNILLRLNARLQYRLSHDDEHNVGSHDAMDSLLRSVHKRETGRVDAALRWALDGPAAGQGGLLGDPTWSNASGACTPVPPQSERVVVLCGPAHVDSIAERLNSCLGAGTVGATQRLFLARNSALLRSLLLNVDSCTWKDAADASEADHVTPVNECGFLSSSENVAALVAQAEVAFSGAEKFTESDASSSRLLSNINLRLPDSALGPLGTMASRALGTKGARPAGAEARQQGSMPSISPVGSIFVHERLRDLSHRPLPLWPVFCAAYILCPVFFFVVLPFKFDQYWFDFHRKLEDAVPETQGSSASQ